MYKCLPLFVPSNLGETELHMGISPGLGEHMINPVELRTVYKKNNGKDHIFSGYYSFIWVDSVKDAQRAVIKLSRELEKHWAGPIQSDRMYFLPLFEQVGYSLTVNPQKHHEHPVIRVAHYPEDPKRTWNCEIYTSNLVQLQEALFSHERNLLKKRLQVLEKWGAKL